ncbi:MAG TPA: vanadium-dependent haloperoxidase [Chloroflexota bacterium]
MSQSPNRPKSANSRRPLLGRGLTALAGAILLFSTTTAGLAAQRLPNSFKTAATGAARLTSGAIIVDWNKQLVQIVGTPGVQPATIHPTRSFAILHAAMYDAVLAITHSNAPYLFSLNALPGARADAAAAEAGHDTLAALYPSMKGAVDQQLAGELAAIPNGTAKQRGIDVGRLAAAFVLAARADDGSSSVPPPPSPAAGTQPGGYRPTPPFVAPGVFMEWSSVTPFVLQRANQFRPAPPPGLTTAAYAQAINQVKSLGQVNSTTRTAEQTTIAKFWSPPIWITWNQIAENAALRHHSDLVHTARLFALLNLSIADTTIAMYDAKYQYNLWRPVTAIREAGSAGNPAVAADPNWAPLLTASDPSYPGAHSAISAASAAVLSKFYGKHDKFKLITSVLPGVVRSFNSYSAAVTEAGQSRIYAGVHTQLDHVAGVRLGQKVADFVLHKATSHTFGFN